MPFLSSLKRSFNRLISESKSKIFFIVCKFGINEFFRILNYKKLIILIYHGITLNDEFYNPYQLPLSIFKQHLIYLKKKKYSFITLSEWLKLKKKGKPLKTGYVVITFDDGFSSVINHAYPLLKEMKIKGCFYLVTNLIGQVSLLWEDFVKYSILEIEDSEIEFHFQGKIIHYPTRTNKQKLLAISKILLLLRTLDSNQLKIHIKQFKKPNLKKIHKKYIKDLDFAEWNDLKNINSEILEIGSHSSSHCYLDNIDSKTQFEYELLKSKNIIEKKTGNNVLHLAYPHGAFNQEVIDNAKDFNYKTGVTIERGLNTLNDDLFKLKRIVGYRDLTFFKINISGLYPLFKKLKNYN